LLNGFYLSYNSLAIRRNNTRKRDKNKSERFLQTSGVRYGYGNLLWCVELKQHHSVSLSTFH